MKMKHLDSAVITTLAGIIIAFQDLHIYNQLSLVCL